MTRDQIIALALEAGIVVTGEAIWKLCELVAAAERELAETKKDTESTIKESLTVAEPVAWRYQNGITETEYLVWQKGTGGRNWTPLYAEPLPCPTCQSLARTVMMDQTGKA
jgi:hypothetical protein